MVQCIPGPHCAAVWVKNCELLSGGNIQDLNIESTMRAVFGEEVEEANIEDNKHWHAAQLDFKKKFTTYQGFLLPGFIKVLLPVSTKLANFTHK